MYGIGIVLGAQIRNNRFNIGIDRVNITQYRAEFCPYRNKYLLGAEGREAVLGPEKLLP